VAEGQRSEDKTIACNELRQLLSPFFQSYLLMYVECYILQRQCFSNYLM